MLLSSVSSAASLTKGALSKASAAATTSAKFAGLLRKQIAINQAASPPAASIVGKQFRLADGTSVDIDNLRVSARQDLNQIKSQLADLLTRNGVAMNGGVKLQVDAGGATHVVGPSPQSTIGSLVAGDSQLQGLLALVAQKMRILHAARSVSGSGPAAQQSFQTALAGLSDPATTFTVAVTSARAETSFAPAQ